MEGFSFLESLTPEELATIDESQWGNDQLMFSSDAVEYEPEIER